MNEDETNNTVAILDGPVADVNLDEVENSLIMPDSIIDADPDEQMTTQVTDNNLVDHELSTSEARELLQSSTVLKNQPELPDEIETPASKKALLPIFWLVGILSFLAIGIIVIWLLAK